jgi:predicted RNA-binding Zn-ribbon protein involved in translation (DUF1610 family)
MPVVYFANVPLDGIEINCVCRGRFLLRKAKGVVKMTHFVGKTDPANHYWECPRCGRQVMIQGSETSKMPPYRIFESSGPQHVVTDCPACHTPLEWRCVACNAVVPPATDADLPKLLRPCHTYDDFTPLPDEKCLCAIHPSCPKCGWNTPRDTLSGKLEAQAKQEHEKQ